MSETASGEASSGSGAGSKIVTYTCPVCNSEFEDYPSQDRTYCSRECMYNGVDHSGENNPNYNGGDVEVECEVCSDTYTVKPNEVDSTKYCSRECQGKAVLDTGYNGVSRTRTGVYKECDYCGDEIYVEPKRFEKYDKHYCDTQCSVEHNAEIHSGEDHPNWKPDSAHKAFYQTDQWRTARLEALKRDKFTCQSCGEWDTKLHVHHIHPVADGGDKFDLDNLVTLCMPCHNKWEGLYLRPDTRGDGQ